jgi:hypothetical protein
MCTFAMPTGLAPYHSFF